MSDENMIVTGAGNGPGNAKVFAGAKGKATNFTTANGRTVKGKKVTIGKSTYRVTSSGVFNERNGKRLDPKSPAHKKVRKAAGINVRGSSGAAAKPKKASAKPKAKRSSPAAGRGGKKKPAGYANWTPRKQVNWDRANR